MLELRPVFYWISSASPPEKIEVRMPLENLSSNYPNCPQYQNVPLDVRTYTTRSYVYNDFLKDTADNTYPAVHGTSTADLAYFSDNNATHAGEIAQWRINHYPRYGSNMSRYNYAYVYLLLTTNAFNCTVRPLDGAACVGNCTDPTIYATYGLSQFTTSVTPASFSDGEVSPSYECELNYRIYNETSGLLI